MAARCDLEGHPTNFNKVAPNATEVRVAGAVDLPGTARLQLVESVVHFDPQRAVFEATAPDANAQGEARRVVAGRIWPALGQTLR
jgi:hypothetical protein